MRYIPYQSESTLDIKASIKSLNFPLNKPISEFSEKEKLEIYESLIKIVQMRRKLTWPSVSDTAFNAVSSFNLMPQRNPDKYWEKAGISRKNSLLSDWTKVGLDLWASLLNLKSDGR